MTDYKGLKDKIAVKEIKFVIFINIQRKNLTKIK